MTFCSVTNASKPLIDSTPYAYAWLSWGDLLPRGMLHHSTLVPNLLRQLGEALPAEPVNSLPSSPQVGTCCVCFGEKPSPHKE